MATIEGGGFGEFFGWGDNFILGDFSGTNLRFYFGLNFEIDGIYLDIIITKSGCNNVEVTIAKLFDIERIFDTDYYITVSIRDDGSALKPGGKICSGDLLLDFSKGVFPDVVHLCVNLLCLIYYSTEWRVFHRKMVKY